MNLLIDALPRSVMIADTEYRINTDFRASLRVIMAFEDPELTTLEKHEIMLRNLYPIMPHDINEALSKAVWFLDGGKDSPGESDDGPRVYSFGKDDKLIFSAFRQTHGIDLQRAELHWWEFVALFMDVGSDTAFCNLTSLRRRIKTGKATKEEKIAAREMGELFDVPEMDTRTLEQREAERRFFELVEKGKKQREQNKANV